MSATKSRTKRSAARTASPQRRRAQPRTLQFTPGSGHTDWTCPVCRARGTVQHPASVDQATIVSLAREQHAVKQPSCEVR
jgi:hypothetical protein